MAKLWIDEELLVTRHTELATSRRTFKERENASNLVICAVAIDTTIADVSIGSVRRYTPRTEPSQPKTSQIRFNKGTTPLPEQIHEIQYTPWIDVTVGKVIQKVLVSHQADDDVCFGKRFIE